MINERTVKHTTKHLIVITTFIAFFSVAAASFAAPIDEDDQSLFFADGLGLNTSVSWGLGKMAGDSAAYSTRSANTISLNALPGYRVSNFLIGPEFSFQWITQNVRGHSAQTDLRGTGYRLGVGGEWLGWRGFALGASIHFIGSHSVHLKTNGGQERSFAKPLGFRVQAGYQLLPRIPMTFDLAFHYTDFLRRTDSAVSRDISGSPLRHWMGSVGFTYHFGQVLSTSEATTKPAPLPAKL